VKQTRKKVPEIVDAGKTLLQRQICGVSSAVTILLQLLVLTHLYQATSIRKHKIDRHWSKIYTDLTSHSCETHSDIAIITVEIYRRKAEVGISQWTLSLSLESLCICIASKASFRKRYLWRDECQTLSYFPAQRLQVIEMHSSLDRSKEIQGRRPRQHLSMASTPTSKALCILIVLSNGRWHLGGEFPLFGRRISIITYEYKPIKT